MSYSITKTAPTFRAYWLSFVDKDDAEFVGGILIKASTREEAMARAEYLDLIPDGLYDVAFFELDLPLGDTGPCDFDKLYSMEMLEERGHVCRPLAPKPDDDGPKCDVCGGSL